MEKAGVPKILGRMSASQSFAWPISPRRGFTGT